jgi:hypothetical protein
MKRVKFGTATTFVTTCGVAGGGACGDGGHGASLLLGPPLLKG